MDVNIEKEHEMEQVCNALEFGAMALMLILTIAIVLISRKISVIIATGIAKPLPVFPLILLKVLQFLLQL